MLRVKRTKKASGHIEIVLSFVIFIGFVIFLFAMFPVYQTKKSEIGLDSAERGILNLTSVEVNYFSIIFTDHYKRYKNYQCFYYPARDASSKIVVKNASGDRVNATSIGSNWYVCDQSWTQGNYDTFYGFYYSSEFLEEGYGLPSPIPNCADLKVKNDQVGYDIGLVRADYMISYNKTVNLTRTYSDSYESVKGDFSIPAGENFEFAITDLKGNIILNVSRNKPERTTVLSRNTPIQMVYKNGTYVFGMLNVKTW